MSCNILTVKATGGLFLYPAGEKHGHIESSSPSTVVYGNTGYYGPDAKLSIYKGDENIAGIEVQQNYCMVEAGDITVTTLFGNVNVKKIPGSYSGGKGGEVIVSPA